MRIWGEAEELGAVLGAIGAIVLLTFIFPDPDVDLGVSFPGNPPYSPLWYLLNPAFWTKTVYPIAVFSQWACVTAIQWLMVRKKWLSKSLVELQIISTALLFAIHAEQDVTVIMFAPLVSLIPWLVGLEIFQKIPIPGSPQWTCAFGGTSTSVNVYLNPCLSTSSKFYIFSNHIYSLTYVLLIFWVIYPLVIWSKTRKKPASAIVSRVAWGAWGSIRCKWYDWILCDECDDCKEMKKKKGVVRRVSRSIEYGLTPTVPTQPSAPLPTKSRNWVDILILLTLGVVAHDVASIEGFHIPGLHAVYFALPMLGILLGLKLKRRRHA